MQEPSPKCQKLSCKNASQTQSKLSNNKHAYDISTLKAQDNAFTKESLPSSVHLIAFDPPDHFETIEKMFHQLLLSGHSDRLIEKASQ